MKREVIEIVLSMHDMQVEVFRHCYYIGVSRCEGGAPVKLATAIQPSTDDRQQIEKHIMAGTDEVIRLISRYFSQCNKVVNDDGNNEGYQVVKLTATPPHNFPSGLNDTLRNTVERYIVMRAVNLWLQQTMPDEAVIPAAETEKAANELRELMVCRRSPRRENNKPNTNIVI